MRLNPHGRSRRKRNLQTASPNTVHSNIPIHRIVKQQARDPILLFIPHPIPLRQDLLAQEKKKERRKSKVKIGDQTKPFANALSPLVRDGRSEVDLSERSLEEPSLEEEGSLALSFILMFCAPPMGEKKKKRRDGSAGYLQRRFKEGGEQFQTYLGHRPAPRSAV
jgi:hypothetical protein